MQIMMYIIDILFNMYDCINTAGPTCRSSCTRQLVSTTMSLSIFCIGQNVYDVNALDYLVGVH